MLKCSKTGNFGKFKYEIGVTHTREDLRNTLGIGGARRAWKDTWYKVDQVKSESCIIDGPSTQEILALKAITARYGKFVSLDFWRIIAALFTMNFVQNIVYLGNFDIWGTDSLRIWESEGSDAAKAIKPSTDAERLILVYMGYPYLKSDWFTGYDRGQGLDGLKVMKPSDLLDYVGIVFKALTRMSWEGGEAE